MQAKPLNGPCLFFCVNGTFLIHDCSVESGEQYGDFVNLPDSHMEIWDRYYRARYRVDFDYFPRGRVVFRRSDQTYLLYYDPCIAERISQVAERYEGKTVLLRQDEHYQCRKCNPFYCP